MLLFVLSVPIVPRGMVSIMIIASLIICIVLFYRSVSHPFTQINTKPWLHYSVKHKNIIPKLLILFRKCGIIVKK